MSASSFLGSVMKWTGTSAALSLFGVKTHTEIFTDIQISNLLTEGSADKVARTSAIRTSGGNAKVYMDSYRAFQRDYRKKYSKKFMEKNGYAPNSTAVTSIADSDLTKAYLQSLYGYTNITIESIKDKYLTLSDKYHHAIRTIEGYDYPTSKIIVDGKHYNNHSYVQGSDETEVVITSVKDYIETIEDNLIDNYSYNGSQVLIGSELYLVGVLSSVINEYDQYETICTHDTLEDVVITTPVTRIVNAIINTVYSSEASYATYRVVSGEVGTETRYWAAKADTAPIYVTSTVDITTIIPLKEDNIMSDLDSTKLNKMLGKLNLSGEELETSIDNDDMDSAYLMTGIDPQYDDDITNKTLFNIFDHMTDEDGDINISISKLDMKYKFNITKETITGSIGEVGTVTRTAIEETSSVIGSGESEETLFVRAGMVLRTQNNSTEYREITITDFSQTYTLSGQEIVAYLDTTGGYARIVIPLDIFNKLKYKEFVYIYEISLCLLAYSVEAVVVEWYETAAFGTLLKIAAVVIFVASGGLSGGVSAAMISMATTAAIMVAASYIAKAIGGTFGAIVGAIIAIAGMYYNPFGAGMTDGQLWLAMADQAIGVVNQVTAMKMDELIANMEAFIEEMTTKMEELATAAEEYDDTNPYGFVQITPEYAGTSSTLYLSIEDYCSNILEGADMDYLTDYGRQIEYNIGIRNSVISGIA